MKKSPDEEIADALGRILNDCPRDGDGKLLLIWLRRKQCEILPMGVETCAVHEHNGQRRLAAEILNYAVTSEHGTEHDEYSNTRTDIAHERQRRKYAAERAAGARARGAGRRVPE